MKKLFTVLVIIIILFITLFLVKDRLIKPMVSLGIMKVTGAPVHMDYFSLGMINSTVSIKGFKMYNPEGFPRDILVDIPAVNVEYDLSALLKRTLHLPLVEFDLKELIVIKNKDGRLNVDALKFVENKEHLKAQEERKHKRASFHIELLRLNIGRVIYKDFSVGAKPLIQVYDINLKKTYKNINSATQLAALFFTESLRSTTIKGAAIYGVATVVGFYAIPVGVVVTLAGNDSVKADFNQSTDLVYEVSLETLDELGDIITVQRQQHTHAGIIKGRIHGIEAIIKILQKTQNSVQITVSARKLLIPKPHIAEGVLFEISEKLNNTAKK